MSVGTRVAGADGCKAGWVVVTWHDGSVDSVLVRDARALGDHALEADVLAVDIPIGLTDSGPRQCDLAARRLLGHPRGASVFPAPTRALVEADELSYAETCALSRRHTGKAISRQAYGLLPKIRDVDALLRSVPELRHHIREVHPEVSFFLWNGGRAMQFNKKKREGRQERLALVERDFPGAFARARRVVPRSRAGDDDILDAFAACWTARRIVASESTTLPIWVERDARGLPMEIVA